MAGECVYERPGFVMPSPKPISWQSPRTESYQEQREGVRVKNDMRSGRSVRALGQMGIEYDVR